MWLLSANNLAASLLLERMERLQLLSSRFLQAITPLLCHLGLEEIWFLKLHRGYRAVHRTPLPSQLLFCPKSLVLDGAQTVKGTLWSILCGRVRFSDPLTPRHHVTHPCGKAVRQHALECAHSCVASGVVSQLPPQVNLRTGSSDAHVWSDARRAYL